MAIGLDFAFTSDSMDSHLLELISIMGENAPTFFLEIAISQLDSTKMALKQI
ncbi:MAG: hypothetical protein U0176_13575 [Bacteroidia bacterium]